MDFAIHRYFVVDFGQFHDGGRNPQRGKYSYRQWVPTWSGGTISGGGLSKPRGALPSTATARRRTRGPNNYGTTTWSGGNVNFSDGAILDNEPGAIVTIASSVNMSSDGSSTLFENDGALVQSNGLSFNEINVPFNQAVTGSTEVDGERCSWQGTVARSAVR